MCVRTGCWQASSYGSHIRVVSDRHCDLDLVSDVGESRCRPLGPETRSRAGAGNVALELVLPSVGTSPIPDLRCDRRWSLPLRERRYAVRAHVGVPRVDWSRRAEYVQSRRGAEPTWADAAVEDDHSVRLASDPASRKRPLGEGDRLLEWRPRPWHTDYGAPSPCASPILPVPSCGRSSTSLSDVCCRSWCSSCAPAIGPGWQP